MSVPAVSNNHQLQRPTIGQYALRASRDKRFLGERPPKIGAVTSAEITQAINALDEYLLPAGKPRLVARITTMFAHYWTPQMPENLQDAVIHEWIQIIGKYPSWAVEKACRQWVESEDRKRPTPAVIGKLCHEYTASDSDRLARLKTVMRVCTYGPEPVERTPPTQAEKDAVSAMVAEALEGVAV